MHMHKHMLASCMHNATPPVSSLLGYVSGCTPVHLGVCLRVCSVYVWRCSMQAVSLFPSALLLRGRRVRSPRGCASRPSPHSARECAGESWVAPTTGSAVHAGVGCAWVVRRGLLEGPSPPRSQHTSTAPSLRGGGVAAASPIGRIGRGLRVSPTRRSRARPTPLRCDWR